MYLLFISAFIKNVNSKDQRFVPSGWGPPPGQATVTVLYEIIFKASEIESLGTFAKSRKPTKSIRPLSTQHTPTCYTKVMILATNDDCSCEPFLSAKRKQQFTNLNNKTSDNSVDY